MMEEDVTSDYRTDTKKEEKEEEIAGVAGFEQVMIKEEAEEEEEDEDNDAAISKEYEAKNPRAEPIYIKEEYIIKEDLVEDERRPTECQQTGRSRTSDWKSGRKSPARERKVASRPLKRRRTTWSDEDPEYRGPETIVGSPSERLGGGDRDPLKFDEYDAPLDDADGTVPTAADGSQSTRRKMPTLSSNENKCDSGNTNGGKDRCSKGVLLDRPNSLNVSGVQCPRTVSQRLGSENANISSLGSMLYCDNCFKEYESDCPTHGPFMIVEDTPVPIDIKDESRAKKTAPPQVCVVDCESDGGAKRGVYATTAIPARTRFGPYQGQCIPPEACTAYSWLIQKKGEPAHCIDASEVSTANWMRYVNCARRNGEHSVDAFQLQDEIYYTTIRSLSPDDELVVWCGDQFSARLEDASADGEAAAAAAAAAAATTLSIEHGMERKSEELGKGRPAPSKVAVSSQGRLSPCTHSHSASADYITPDHEVPVADNIIEHLLNGSFEIGLSESDNLLLMPFSLLQSRDGTLNSPFAREGSAREDSSGDSGKAKRASNPSRWKTNLAKLAVQTGAEHMSAAGNLIKKRQLQPACKPSCRFQCSQRVEESFRVQVFNHFWSITNQTDKWDFISKHVKVNEKKSNTANVTRRKSSRQYFFHINGKDVKVCKTMFVSTLDICDGVVETVARKVMNNGYVTPDKRGSNTKRTGIHQQVKNSAAEHINAFPRIPSHYLKAVTNKEYLEEGLTVKKMHELYLEWMKTNNPQDKQATERQYRDVFNSDFDIAFFTPQKEKCDLCHQWETWKLEEKVSIQEMHVDHVAFLTKQRELFKSDSDTAAKLKTTFCLASFDFHKVFHTPKAQASVFYYKSKLAVYNFTVYDLIRHDGFCYVYDESTAHKGSNESASFLLHFIQEQAKLGINTFRFYTNNCTPENKNLFMFSMLLLAAARFKVNVAVRYLQEGHSQTEGDAVQSRIEKTVRNVDIFSPPEWYHQIREAKKSNPYHTVEVTQDDVFDFSDLVDRLNFALDSSGRVISVSQTRDVVVDADNVGRLKYRFNFHDDYSTLATLGGAQLDLATYTLKKAYCAKFGVDSTRFEDFISLCERNDMPAQHQAFYRSLVPALEGE